MDYRNFSRGRRMVELAKSAVNQSTQSRRPEENASQALSGPSKLLVKPDNHQTENTPEDLLEVSLISDLDISVTSAANELFHASIGSIGEIVPDVLQTEPRSDVTNSVSNSVSESPTVHQAAPDSPQHLPEQALQRLIPENFHVDGSPRSAEIDLTKNQKKRKREEAKTKRNLGLAYVSTNSKKTCPGRRQVRERCGGIACQKRKLGCLDISDAQRDALLHAFWDIGELHEQRNWVSRHVSSKATQGDSKRQRNVLYSLPADDTKVPVCQVMFLNTLNISEKFVRTVLSKTDENGILQGDQRGGHRKFDDSAIKTQSIKTHIDRFPRMESHYCRANSSWEYLSSDLTIAKMFDLYKECEQSKKVHVSYELYKKIFHQQKLKFHHPKKDTCGICETKRSGSALDSDFQQLYDGHIKEKEAARAHLSALKSKAKEDPKLQVAIFDLEKVLYLPKSNRGEIFYKRRLANYNFTVFETMSGQGYCFVWNESLAGRGANEIASCLYRYLKDVDAAGTEQLALFSDGCVGQNKNSILPAMIRTFLKSSLSLQSVTMHFFEKNHGQSEGDSMHSVVEAAYKRIESIMVPSELVGIIKSAARKKPYIVNEIHNNDIIDWKATSGTSGVLRVRKSDEGMPISWPDFMQIKIRKDTLDKIEFKTSHLQESFATITLPPRRKPEVAPTLIEASPKISKGKYKDLAALCNGPTPVISNPDHKRFYLSLPHD